MAQKTRTIVRYAKKKSHRRAKMTIPLAVVAGIAAPGIKIYEARVGGVSGMAREAGRIMTGWDFWNGTFNFATMRYGMFPVLAGIAAHKVASMLGINRAIARTGLPYIRI
jgi:hypothetical protein